MYALIDLDPDGIAIMSTYKYGSYRLLHENISSEHTSGLSLPNIRWLGVKHHHIGRGSGQKCGGTAGYMTELQGWMRMTVRDRKKAIQMLGWDLCCETGPEQEWRHQLQAMLTLNIKAEIQILEDISGGVVSFLATELDRMPKTTVDTTVEMACSDDGLLF